MAATPDGGGYWLVRADGQVSAFGDARLYGSPTGGRSTSVAIIPIASGTGYWVVLRNGGVMNYGTATPLGAAHVVASQISCASAG
jgi:hypothetical protein